MAPSSAVAGSGCRAVEQMRLDALGPQSLGLVGSLVHGAGHAPAGGPGKSGDFEAAEAQAEDEKTFCHLVRIAATRFFSTMLFLARPCSRCWRLPPRCPPRRRAPLHRAGLVRPLRPPTPDHLKRYTDCMALARNEPLKALPVAEKWNGEGGGLGARHCVAIAMFEAGRYVQAATQFEAIARDMGRSGPACAPSCGPRRARPGSRPEQAEKAAAAQSRALELKGNDPDLWVDRGLSYAAMRAWPRAISDFDHALTLRPNDVEILVLRAAAWRNAGDPARGAGRRRSTRSGSRRIIPRRCSSAALPFWRGATATGQQRLRPGAAARAAGLGRGPARRGGPARRAAGRRAGATAAAAKGSGKR